MLSKPQFSDDLVREPKLQLLDNLAPSGRNCNPKPKIYDLGGPDDNLGAPRPKLLSKPQFSDDLGASGAETTVSLPFGLKAETVIQKPKIDDLGPR